MPPPAGQPQADSPSEFASNAIHPRVLVTAGPTHEPVDEVRFIGNRSSGRMGIALAEEATARGWPTTLLLGPVAQPPPDGMPVSRFQTGAQLQALLREQWPGHDILFMAAAVSDFIPETPGTGKRSRREGPTTLSLKPAPDLLAQAAATSSAHQTLIGFALEEPGELQARGEMKLREKGLHAVVANPLETINADQVTAILLVRDEKPRIPPEALSKPDFAVWLLDQALAIHRSRQATTT